MRYALPCCSAGAGARKRAGGDRRGVGAGPLLVEASAFGALGAVLGVLNFVLAEIVDRRREIGLLRTVALNRRQVLSTLTAEAVLVGLCGGVLAIAWGWPMAYAIVTHSTRMVSGWQLTFDFPWGLALLMPAIVALTAAVAAWLPAWTMSRTRLTSLVGVE